MVLRNWLNFSYALLNSEYKTQEIKKPQRAPRTLRKNNRISVNSVPSVVDFLF
ncbi:MAG: hypothetical protein O8C60_05705 [Candidatus Methanoperedens sp.]|nr:hypothetical protein [Candidatus Methanoperedens sp.]